MKCCGNRWSRCCSARDVALSAEARRRVVVAAIIPRRCRLTLTRRRFCAPLMQTREKRAARCRRATAPLRAVFAAAAKEEDRSKESARCSALRCAIPACRKRRCRYRGAQESQQKAAARSARARGRRRAAKERSPLSLRSTSMSRRAVCSTRRHDYTPYYAEITISDHAKPPIRCLPLTAAESCPVRSAVHVRR